MLCVWGGLSVRGAFTFVFLVSFVLFVSSVLFFVSFLLLFCCVKGEEGGALVATVPNLKRLQALCA